MTVKYVFLSFLLCLAAACAGAPASASDYSLSAGYGSDIPFGGRWGDKNAGFRSAPAFKVSLEKPLDDLLSYGLDSSMSTGHKNKKIPDLNIKIFSLVAYLRASYLKGGHSYYSFVGAGFYQWTQNSFKIAGVSCASASGASPGILLGGGVRYPFWFGSRASLEARWQHVFNMKGGGFNLDSADNLGLMFVVSAWL
ncbi:MAG: hypothetical protein NTX59_13375 [Elusimicrobia bacterium]|nr:hypothetical protein [Elusimicrobiota bacterium]